MRGCATGWLLDEQGHSPFVWAVIGAIAQAAPGIPVTTAVTCPTIRIHPAVIAQAAATSAVVLKGRFRLGVGSGESLNEHILGSRWPGAGERLEMLEEAVHVIRTLWQPGVHDQAAWELAQVLPTPEHFAQASELVTEAMVAEAVTCGDEVDRHIEAISKYRAAGFDELYVNQIGPDQHAFFDAYRDHLLPELR